MGEGASEAAAGGVRKSSPSTAVGVDANPLIPPWKLKGPLIWPSPFQTLFLPPERICFHGRADLNDGHALLGSRPDSLLPFNPPAPSVGIGRAVGAVGIARAILIIEGLGGIRTSVAAVGVTGRIRIVWVRAQLAAIVPLRVVEPWGVGRIGVGG